MGCCNSKDEIIVPNIEVSNDHDEQLSNTSPEKIQLNTKYTVNEVKICKFTPRQSQNNMYAYMCPICMYFFSTVLVTKCCKNYLCHYCVEEMKTYKLNFSCPYCLHNSVVLEDPLQGDNIKKYL